VGGSYTDSGTCSAVTGLAICTHCRFQNLPVAAKFAPFGTREMDELVREVHVYPEVQVGWNARLLVHVGCKSSGVVCVAHHALGSPQPMRRSHG
jgi:hypothetical protein